MSEPKVLYIDFDRTLTNDRCWRSLPADKHDAVQSLLFGGNVDMVHGWMRGRYSAEQVNKYVAETIGIPYKELWDVLVEDCRTMHVPIDMLQVISELKKKYTVMLITGNMDSFTRFTVPSLELGKYFHHISCSHDVGKHKTDNGGELFSYYAELLEVPLERSVLIDDQDKCCQVFSDLGGTSLQTTSIEHTKEILLGLI